MLNPMHHILAQAAANPAKIAIEGGYFDTNYGQFADGVKRVASALRGAGVRPGHVVGLRLDRGVQGVFWGAVMHEAAVAFAASRPVVDAYGEHIDWLVTDDIGLSLKGKTIRINPQWLEGLGRINPRVDVLDYPSMDAPVRLAFSSGTTGTPKGVAFSTAMLCTRAEAAERTWMPAQPFFSQLGMDTPSGMLTQFWSLLGNHAYFQPAIPPIDADTINRFEIATLKTSPSKLMDIVSFAEEKGLRWDSLQTLEVAGGTLSPVLAARFAALSPAKIRYLYGSTEAGTVITGEYDPADPTKLGQPVAGTSLQIVGDAVAIQTPFMAREYWMAPEASAKAFANGSFWPGDTGALDPDGSFRVLGRTDELVNAAGAKVDPAWIDLKIAEYRGITEAAAFGYLDPRSGGQALALAFVAERELSVENLQNHLRDTFQNIRFASVMRVEEIPRNAFGKVQRNQLAAQLEASLANG
ncbi:MAG: class I adenylate-forming enzyme family protein [Micrococcales bacterium]